MRKASKVLNAREQEARWGHNYDDGTLGGTWSQKQGRIQADQGHQIKVLWIYLISPSIQETLIKYF